MTNQDEKETSPTVQLNHGTADRNALGTSPMKIQIQNEELIEMTDPTESFVLSESQQQTVASLFAGVGSGTMASIACAPLDLVRTRMQVLGDLNRGTSVSNDQLSIIKSIREIVQKDGVKGCFRGLAPTLMTVPTFWGLYFPLYEITKKDLHRFHYEGSDVPSGPIIHMASAIFAGAIADFFCNPMFVVRTRMQTEVLHYMDVPVHERKPHGIMRTVKSLYNEGGVLMFWRGFTASLLGLSHVGIQFPVYEYLKAEARKRSVNNEETALDLLLASATSKMVATSITYPHEVIRSRIMDYRGDDAARKSLISTFKRIVRNEGVRALYTGIHVSLVRVLPNCCITFMSYEMILKWSKSYIMSD
jgi:Mitochondrial carrier protein.